MCWRWILVFADYMVLNYILNLAPTKRTFLSMTTAVSFWSELGMQGFVFLLVVWWILGLYFFCLFRSDANIVKLGRVISGLPRIKIMHVIVAKRLCRLLCFLFCLFFVLFFFLLNSKDPKLLSMAYSAVGKLSRWVNSFSVRDTLLVN